MWVLLYKALYYTVYWSDKGIVLLLFSLFASARDLTDFLNWFFSAFCLAVQRLDIFFFKSFRKGLFMISVHKTIVEIQNPEIISVCGLVCSINFWVHVRYKPEPLTFSYPEVPHILKPESSDTSPSIHVQIQILIIEIPLNM